MKKIALATILALWCNYLIAQTCSGVWGPPVVNQTFGQGNATDSWYGPLTTYAPGASTSTTFVGAAGPVGGILTDGFSGLARVPSASGQGNWVSTTDHTGNPNGLMFLINAPSTANTVFFEYTMSNLCPNTTLQLSLWMLNANISSLTTNPTYQYPNMSISVVDPVTNAVIATINSGNVPADAAWHNYVLTFTNGTNTSVKLQLTNFSVGSGFGNDLAIDDIVVRACVPNTSISPKIDSVACNRNVSIPFTANVTNSPYSPPEYVWQYSSDNGVTWINGQAPGTNPSYTFNMPATSPGTYWIRFLTGPTGFGGNTNCSAISDTSVVRLSSTQGQPTVVSPVNYCLGATAGPLSATTSAPGNNLVWYTSATGGTGTAVPPVPATSAAGSRTYYVSQTNNLCGEGARAPIVVNVSAPPAPPTIVTPVVYCQGDVAAPLTATGTNLKWYAQPVGGGGVSAPVIPPTLYEDTLVYWVTQSNLGCESIRSKQEVHVRYKPNGIILGTQASICQGVVDTFEYFGNATIHPDAIYSFKTPGFYTTLLSGSGKGPYIVRFDSAGTYTVKMQINNNGCVSDEMTYTVTVRPSPAIGFSSKQDACLGEVVSVALYYTSNNVTQYDYDFAGGQMVYGTATGGPYGIKWLTTGTKVITLNANTIGCPARTTYDTIRIHNAPDARISTVSANSICTGDSVLFTASEQDSNTHFYWTPDNFFSSGNVYQAWGVVKKDGYVRLDVESVWGCRSSDSVKINAKPCCELFFPNVFSPNNDGKNDLFHPVTQGHHNIVNFRVVNRWGQTVYESKDERRGWDGTYNGKQQDMGTYFYYVKYQCSSNEYFEQKGELILLR